jgi:hypothetical protein
LGTFGAGWPLLQIRESPGAKALGL